MKERTEGEKVPVEAKLRHEQKPRKLRKQRCQDAWMYSNKNSLEVYMVGFDGETLSCVISRRQLQTLLGIPIKKQNT